MTDKFGINEYTNYQECFKNYLGGWSFPDGDEVLTIKSVQNKEMYDSQTGEQKLALCIEFNEKPLPMVLNVTNAETIAIVTGTDKVKGWIGKQIVVGTSRIRAFGKETKAIRVRNEKPRAKAKGTPITDDQKQVILDLAQSGAIKMDPMLSYYCVGSLDEISREQAAELIRIKSGKVSE